MPKYWGKQIFSLRRFPEVGQKQKTEKKEERKIDRNLVITMASSALQMLPRVAHEKPPGPKGSKIHSRPFKDQTIIGTTSHTFDFVTVKQQLSQVIKVWNQSTITNHDRK